ncbi:hypothetical protein RHS01_03129 [Rhizoctonia solani]|uniref:Uncharacterized protein n=1 Tax=Rhizoctonia solani TaxID=456999 RepID=A0A8H7IIJ5_9AGAM|nr:hypothetical protein RHS01_03129 [Rhizoctonia solani]
MSFGPTSAPLLPPHNIDLHDRRAYRDMNMPRSFSPSPSPPSDQNEFSKTRGKPTLTPRRPKLHRNAGDIQVSPAYAKGRKPSVTFTGTPTRPTHEHTLPSPETTPPPTRACRRIELPWKLIRPEVSPVLSETLAVMDRGLKGVPVEFVVHKLQTIGPEQRCAPSSIFPSINTAALPSELELHIRDRSQPLEAIPTHLLCVFNPHAGKASKGHLFPAHSLVLASQCSKFPQVGPATRIVDHERGTTRLPVVPLPVPHPASFGFLNAYLYTRRIDKVLATLIPLPTQTLAGISAGMANQPGRRHSRNVEQLQGTRVDDERLWKVLELAWDIVVAAISASSGTNVTPKSS